MANLNSALLILLLLASAFLIYGCTGGVNYISCCERGRIYDTSSTPSAILDDPRCFLSDGSNSGTPYRCDKESTERLGGTGNCTIRACSDISKEEECNNPCEWTVFGCSGRPGTDGKSYSLIPVCTDAVPKNCINNSCQAMVCGYSGYKIGPQPTAADFEKAASGGTTPFSSSELAGISLNLQGTSCDFKVMDQKLYNQFRQSKGGLWVNTFRFGVGRSFSDFEQSRYFFPASDRFCSSSIMPGKDRFLVYNNAPDWWCGDFATQGGTQYYRCDANGLEFSDSTTCRKYCFGRTPTSTPPDCNPVPLGAASKYVCLSSSIIYSGKDECRQGCAILDDPGACTNDLSKFPFLESDLRYKSELSADYYYGTNTVSSSCGIFTSCQDDFEAACKQEHWREEGGVFDRHYACNDFYPYDCNSDDFDEGDCLWNPDYDNDYIQGFNWAGNRVFSSELDTDYYGNRLLAQTVTPGQENAKAPFECEAGTECLSGACDTSAYRRVMCTDAADPTRLIDCGCDVSGTGYACGDTGSSDPSNMVFRFDRTVGGVGDIVVRSPISFGTDSGNDAIYFVTKPISSPANPRDQLEFLKSCDINEIGRTQACIARVMQISTGEVHDAIIYGSSPADCAGRVTNPDYRVNYAFPFINDLRMVNLWRYQMHFSPGTSWGSIGKCKLLGQPDDAPSPYLDVHVFGWCAGCTSSTLAVQKVTFNAPSQFSYSCLDFRASYDYDVQSGIQNGFTGGDYGSSRIDADFKVSPVTRAGALSDYTTPGENGPISRGYYDQGWFGHDATYVCDDGWTGGWHDSTEPSQAQLVEKMTGYMRANIMPILEFEPANTPLSIAAEPVFGGAFGSLRFKYGTSYKPTDICTDYGADGAAIYIVGGMAEVSNAGQQGDRYEGDGIGESGMANYFALNGDAVQYTLPGSYNSVSTAQKLNSRAAAVYKAWMLKKMCPHAPLAAITMSGYEDLSSVIGTKDAPGPLHEFFFSRTNPEGRYDRRVAAGTPDKYPDEIDLILQEWHPTCDVPGVANPTIAQATEYEFSSRLNFSRALLSNFSKPSLVWRFDFPQGSRCFEVINGKRDYTYFLNYVFDRQADMVDAGMIGLIYDNWMTADGGTYLASVPDGGGMDGASSAVASDGPLDLPFASGSQPAGKTEIFCALQSASNKVLGLNKLAYGQKIYAEKKPVVCSPCSITDISAGLCTSSTDPAVINDPGLPQLYCAGGHKCSMPLDTTGTQRTDYGNFMCPAFSVDYDLCAPCSGLAGKQAYCRIEQSDGTVEERIVDYAGITDLDWSVLASLPNKDKCCLSAIDPASGAEERYTYTERAGVIQKNELLQFPRRGNPEIDCGRPPTTEFLQYCNIPVLSTNSHSYCNAIN